MKIDISGMTVEFSNCSGSFIVVDYIESDKPKTVFKENGFRSVFLTQFPEGIFDDGGISFYIDFRGSSVIMEVWDIESIRKYVDQLKTYTYKEMDWHQIFGEIEKHYAILN